MPEILTDEQAAAIWSGQTTSLLGMEPTKVDPKVEEKKVDDVKKEDVKVEPKQEANKSAVKEEDLDNLFSTEETILTDDTTSADDTNADSTGKKGRKVTDLVQIVNQLITEDVLSGYQDAEGNSVDIKTIDEAKQLIKDNLAESGKDKKEEWKKEYREEFSPQVQAILHYAEQGAQSATQLFQLMGAIQQVEEAVEIDMNTPQGHEQVIRQIYKAKGFKDSYIDKQVNILKDLGEDRIKVEAEELYPELVQAKQEQVKRVLAEQDVRRKEAEEASKVYVSTIKQTLSKDVIGGVKLSREDKAKLYEAVTQPKYTSLNGTATNLFVKTLEDLQFGKNANYDHFMNVVQYAIDPKAFVEKLKTSVGNDIADDTFRKLKTAKGTAATSVGDNTSDRSALPKKGIKKGGDFVNPFQ